MSDSEPPAAARVFLLRAWIRLTPVPASVLLSLAGTLTPIWGGQKRFLDGICHCFKSILQHRRFVLDFRLKKRYPLRRNINQFVMEEFRISKSRVGTLTARRRHRMDRIA